MLAWQMQTAGQKLLAEAGFDQYEVSAYARPGKRCRHNMNYWLFGDYLGLGAGAHGKLSFALPQRILRTTKPKQPREYQEQMQTRTQGVAGEPDPDRRELVHCGRGLAVRIHAECTAAQRRLQRFAIIGSEPVLNWNPWRPNWPMPEVGGCLESRADGWRPTELGRRFLNDLQASFLA